MQACFLFVVFIFATILQNNGVAVEARSIIDTAIGPVSPPPENLANLWKSVMVGNNWADTAIGPDSPPPEKIVDFWKSVMAGNKLTDTAIGPDSPPPENAAAPLPEKIANILGSVLSGNGLAVWAASQPTGQEQIPRVIWSPPPIEKWCVYAKTGNKWFAGTDARISMIIIGETGGTKRVYLDKPTDDHERNGHFDFCYDFDSFGGSPSSIFVCNNGGYDETGGGANTAPNWHIDMIALYKGSPSPLYTHRKNIWLKRRQCKSLPLKKEN